MSYNDNDPEVRRLLGLDGLPDPMPEEEQRLAAASRELLRKMQSLAPENSEKANPELSRAPRRL